MQAPRDRRSLTTYADRLAAYRAGSNQRASLRASLEGYPVEDYSRTSFVSSSSNNLGNGRADMSEIAPFKDLGSYVKREEGFTSNEPGKKASVSFASGSKQPTTRGESTTGPSVAAPQLRRKSKFGPLRRRNTPTTTDVVAGLHGRADGSKDTGAATTTKPTLTAGFPARSTSSFASLRKLLRTPDYGPAFDTDQIATRFSAIGREEAAQDSKPRESAKAACGEDKSEEYASLLGDAKTPTELSFGSAVQTGPSVQSSIDRLQRVAPWELSETERVMREPPQKLEEILGHPAAEKDGEHSAGILNTQQRSRTAKGKNLLKRLSALAKSASRMLSGSRKRKTKQREPKQRVRLYKPKKHGKFHLKVYLQLMYQVERERESC